MNVWLNDTGRQEPANDRHTNGCHQASARFYGQLLCCDMVERTCVSTGRRRYWIC